MNLEKLKKFKEIDDLCILKAKALISVMNDLINRNKEYDLVNKSAKELKKIYLKSFVEKEKINLELVDWKGVEHAWVKRSELPEVIELGKCKCLIDSYPEIKGMEGILKGNNYNYELVESGKDKYYYRIFHNIETSYYYETCSVKEFKNHFKELIEERIKRI